MDVYMLGAGFSSDAGVPTMKNFLKGVTEAKKASLHSPVLPLLDRAACYARETGQENIEDLLISAVNEPVFFDLIWAFGLTINYFSRKFLDECRFGGDVGWYADFADIISSKDTRILTFNYDLILEEVLWWRLGCAVDYHITFGETHHAPTHQNHCVVPVYKLHGSISWLWCLQCRYTVNLNRHFLQAAYEEKTCPKCSFRLIPLMVPPTFRKAKSLAAPLKPLWQQADTILSTATRIVIGGLSFNNRDEDLRHKFQNAVASNTKLAEIVLINRDKSTCHAIESMVPGHVACRTFAGFSQFCREFKKI